VVVGFAADSSRWWSWTLLLALPIAWLTLGGTAWAAPSAQVLAPGQVLETSLAGSTGTAPADGRLRGPDFTAQVARVAWPQTVSSPSGTTYVAGTRRRLITFSLSVTQASANSGVGDAPTGVTAKLTVAGTSLPVSMSSIDQQVAGGTSGSAQTTGTDSFVASVPARAHDVALTLSEGGFSQSLDLWTLQRVPPSPVVLYRDPTSPTVTGTAAGPFHVNFTNPADGFSSSDDAQITGATLTYFSGSSNTTPGNPAQAFLVVELQSSYPSIPYGQPNSGHFFSGFSPLAGSQFTFTPTGGSAVPATADTTDFSSTNAASDDDGLFDALYSFVVPATTTGGTLSVLPGTANGTEYTGFTGTGTTVPISITAPATVGLSFPALPSAPAAQKKPPWMGAPLPSTGLAAAPASVAASGSDTSSGSPSTGFPIWAVILILVLVAAGVVAWQSRRRRPTPAMASSALDAAVPTTPSTGNVEAAEPIREPLAEPPPIAPAVPEPAASPARPGLRSRVLGPPDALGMKKTSDRRVIEELFHYLALHDAHHRSAEQVLVALRPDASSDDDLTRKTIHTYLSELRACVGSEHLPSATVAGGYLLLDVTSDWADFVHLERRADATSGEAAWALRFEALALVRGVPFAGVPSDAYQWVGTEHLFSTMTTAIARCASRLAHELLDAGDVPRAEDAARAGLRGAPDEYELWRLGALAIHSRGERSALRRWMSDAKTHLEAGEIARIEGELGPHDDPPEEDT
jgi:DNA-binding SARP family transcriptional activator